MTRRQFLLVMSLVSTFGCIDFPFGNRRPDRLRNVSNLSMARSEIRQCLQGIFSDLESPRVIGKLYLELYPHERFRSLFLAECIQSTQVQSPEALRTVLAHKCEADFRNGEMVTIDGFLLARTEVEACALTVLL